MFLDNAMERINRLILQGGRTGMTENQFFAAEIKEWKNSQRRKDQVIGDLYYEGQHDILQRQRTIIGENGQLQVVTNLPNNRLIDNQYALMVDQKTNYLVGKPFTLNCQDKGYTDALGKVFNKRFYRLLKYVCEDALNGGLGWLYPYYNEAGELSFKHFPAYDILPFWADDDHTILDCAIRYYTQEVWNGYQKEKVEKVEIFKADGIYRYIYQNDMLIADVEAGEHENYFMVEEEGQEPKGFNWTRIPLVPFKYNKQEIPLIRRVKTLQDGINTMISDFENNMQEDARNTILVLKNYDGENLGEFRHNLSTYVIRDYAEFQGIMGSEQPEIEKAWNTTDDLLDNQFIPTAGNMGLSRWEKILGITPKGTDSLEDRRFRILTRINEELPYTLPQLRNILETLCGKGNYSADVEEGTYQLLVKIGLAAKNNFNDVESLLNRVVPQNMVVTLLQLYNTHAELGRFTHAQLAAYTHNQLRNEVLKNGE